MFRSSAWLQLSAVLLLPAFVAQAAAGRPNLRAEKMEDFRYAYARASVDQHLRDLSAGVNAGDVVKALDAASATEADHKYWKNFLKKTKTSPAEKIYIHDLAATDDGWRFTVPGRVAHLSLKFRNQAQPLELDGETIPNGTPRELFRTLTLMMEKPDHKAASLANWFLPEAQAVGPGIVLIPILSALGLAFTMHEVGSYFATSAAEAAKDHFEKALKVCQLELKLRMTYGNSGTEGQVALMHESGALDKEGQPRYCSPSFKESCEAGEKFVECADKLKALYPQAPPKEFKAEPTDPSLGAFQ